MPSENIVDSIFSKIAKDHIKNIDIKNIEKDVKEKTLEKLSQSEIIYNDVNKILVEVHDIWKKKQEQLIVIREQLSKKIMCLLFIQFVILIFILIVHVLGSKDLSKLLWIFSAIVFTNFLILPLQLSKFVFPTEDKEYTSKILELILGKLPNVK